MAESQPQGGRVIEFIAPLGMDRCAERLQGRHQRRTFLAWDWQTRLNVQVEPVDATTVRFRMRRVDKNSWLAWGSLVELRGVMRGLSDTQTVVRAAVQWSLVWAALQMIAFGGFGFALVLGIAGEENLTTQWMLRATLAGLIGMLLGLLFVWWWGGRHLRGMIGALKEATGYLGG